MPDDTETLKLRWRDEAQAAVAHALAEGEARGREAAAAEVAELRQQILELAKQSASAQPLESVETVKLASSRRAKSYLNELYGRLKEVECTFSSMLAS
jgi:plasmid stabilization system protein ParE